LASSHTALGNLHAETGRREQAEAEFRKALSLRESLANKFSKVASLHNSLAWFLVSCADRQVRDSQRALEHAQKAVSLSPGETRFQNTLGVAQYRNQQYDAAVKSLKESQSDASEGTASDLFFLAMSYQQLGKSEMARTHYDRACEWMKLNRPDDIELLGFCREASALLGIQPTSQSNSALSLNEL
jgi:tetratricopeptide (TPR) repeat protein